MPSGSSRALSLSGWLAASVALADSEASTRYSLLAFDFSSHDSQPTVRLGGHLRGLVWHIWRLEEQRHPGPFGSDCQQLRVEPRCQQGAPQDAARWGFPSAPAVGLE